MAEVMGVSYEKIVIVGNGVEDLFFEKPDASLIQEFEPYVLVVGGLQPRKGHTHVMELSSLLKRANSSLRIRVAGRGEAWCEQEGRAAGNIDLLGYVTDENLRQLMQKATALLMLSEYEGFGIPVLEAMASGCPAIVIDRAALPEIAGTAGLVVRSAEEAFEGLRMLMSNEVRRAQLIAAGRERAENFRWDACVKRLASVLQ
jgi:glycosyltransferase involved in cell wall biosynthesis